MPAARHEAPLAGTTTAHRTSFRAITALVAVIALLARVAYWALGTPRQPLTSDAAQYHFLAANVAEGRGFVDVFPQMELHATAFRPPGYPFVLSVVYRLLGPAPGIGRAVNVLIGVAVVVTAMALVRRHLGRRSAVAVGLGVALWPNFIANDTNVLTEPLSLLLLVGLLWFLLDDRWALAGCTTGLLVLTRPSAQFLVVLLAIYLLSRLGWRRALLFCGITAAIVAPWVVRNWIQLGHPVLVTSNGFNYAALYSPPADEIGTFVDPTRHPYFDDRRLDQFDEVRWDRNLRRTAVDHIRERPRVIPEVVSHNALAMFEIRPSYNRNAEHLDGRHMGVRSATYWLLWPLVGLGVLGAVRRRRARVVLLSSVIGSYFTLASLAFVAPPRLRAPLELMLMICAAALLTDRSPTSEPDAPSVETGSPQPPGAQGRRSALNRPVAPISS